MDKTKDTHRLDNNVANECISSWIKNYSDHILADPELSVLRKSLNFAVTPRKPPVIDIVTATVSACSSLSTSDFNELRPKVVTIISSNTQVKEQNVTKEEWKAIEELRKDEIITVLPADKGRVTVVMKKEEYREKCKTYLKLKSGATAKYKKQIISALKDLKDCQVIPRTSTRDCTLPLTNPHASMGYPRCTSNKICHSNPL